MQETCQKNQPDEELINLEVERIELLFEKNHYDDEDKKNFIYAKQISALEFKDDLALEVCNRLLNRLNNKN